MTKTQYKAARQLIRDNGLYALRWLSDNDRVVFEKLFYGQKLDHLQERVRCKRFTSGRALLLLCPPEVFHFGKLINI